MVSHIRTTPRSVRVLVLIALVFSASSVLSLSLFSQKAEASSCGSPGWSAGTEIVDGTNGAGTIWCSQQSEGECTSGQGGSTPSSKGSVTACCYVSGAGDQYGYLRTCSNPITCNSNYGKTCTSPENACGEDSYGTIQCNGICSATIPPLPNHYGEVCTSPENSCGEDNKGTINCSGVCSASIPPNPPGYGNSCKSNANACGQTNSGTVNCSGSCSASTPPNPKNYGDSCKSSANACGQTNSGTINCSGNCSASTPPNPNGYGNSCHSSANACGQTNTGTVNCSGSCSASTPPNPNGYGNSCKSSPNACGQTNSGTIQCNGSCSASTPNNPANYGDSCKSAANECGMTNSGTIQCNGSCSASVPSNSLCPKACNSTTSSWGSGCSATQNGESNSYSGHLVNTASGHSGSEDDYCDNGNWSFSNQSCNATACTNGANNPPSCNKCDSGYVYNGSSCVAALGINTHSVNPLTLPNTSFTETYDLTNGNSSNTQCQLLDNTSKALTSYAPCSGSIGYNTPSVVGTYGYYVQAYKQSTGETVRGSFTVTVNAAPTYTITASAGAGGSISPNGSVSVSQGGNKSFTISANSGYKISQVVVDGTNKGAISTYTFSNVQANHSISASFSSTACANGADNPPSCNTCNPPQVYNGSSCIDPISVVANPVNPLTLPNTAFTENYNLTNGNSSNTTCRLLDYTSTPLTGGAGQYAPCSGSINANTPNVAGTYGYYVQAYKKSTGETAKSNEFQVEVDSAAATKYIINASAGAGGFIDPSGAISVSAGANQPFSITPNSGYTVSNVAVDGSDKGALGSYSFTNVQSDHNIIATFTSSGNGGGGGNGPVAHLSPNWTSFCVGETPSTLTWSCDNSTHCKSTGHTQFDPLSPSCTGTHSVGGLNVGDYTYQLTCYDAVGDTDKQSITIQVNDTSTCGNGSSATINANPLVVEPGGSTTVTWSSLNVTSCVVTRNKVTWQSGAAALIGSATDSSGSGDVTYAISCDDGSETDAVTVSFSSSYHEF